MLRAEFANSNIAIEPKEFPADWAGKGRAAGPIRNAEMAKQNPHIVAAFHNDITKSRGTKDMLKRVLNKVQLIILSTGKDITLFIRDDKLISDRVRQMSALETLLKESNI